MADENSGAGPAAPTPTPTADAIVGQLQQINAPQTAPGSDEPLLNKREVVDLRKEMRDAKAAMAATLEAIKALVPQSKAKPDQPPTATAHPDLVEEVRMMRAENDLREGMLEAGVTDKQARLAIQRLFKAERPQNIGDWLPGAIGVLGFARTGSSSPAPATPPATPPQRAAPSSDTGAPAGPRPTVFVVGMNPHEHAALFKSLSREDQAKAMAAWGATTPNANPYARPRKPTNG